MSTAIAAVKKYYSFSIAEMRNMTPDQFSCWISEIETISKLEQGESTPTPSAEMIAQMKNDPAIRNKCGAR